MAPAVEEAVIPEPEVSTAPAKETVDAPATKGEISAADKKAPFDEKEAAVETADKGTDEAVSEENIPAAAEVEPQEEEKEGAAPAVAPEEVAPKEVEAKQAGAPPTGITPAAEEESALKAEPAHAPAEEKEATAAEPAVEEKTPTASEDTPAAKAEEKASE